MSKYRIHHKHYGGKDYYNAEILIRKGGFLSQSTQWYALRGPKGYNGSLQEAKDIIDAHIAEKATHTKDYENYIEYP